MQRNIGKAWGVLVIGASSAWLLVTIINDVSLSISSLLLRSQPYAVIWFSILATILGCVLPLLLSLRFVVTETRAKALRSTNLVSHFGDRRQRRFWHWVLLPAIVGSAYFFYVVERIEPVTVMPFSTTVGTMVFTVVALWLLRQSPTQTRLTVVSICALLILSTRFVDWNSRKPFLRELLQFRNGMTGQQVNGMMGQYMTSQDSDDDSHPGDTLYYRHSDDAEYNADWGKITMRDGKVVAVRFLPD